MAMRIRKVSSLLILLIATSAVTIEASTKSNAVDPPNWMSAANASASACYRQTYLSTEACVAGYESDSIASCWAQCPLEYPVECGMECIPQGSDCTSTVLTKVTSVGTVALNAATAGVFGQLVTASKALELGVTCGQKLFAATSSLVDFIDEQEAGATQPQQLMSVVNESDAAVNELPDAVCTCLGLPVSDEALVVGGKVADVVRKIVSGVVEQGPALLDPSTFLKFMIDVGVGDSVQDLDTDSLMKLEGIITAGMTCGTKLQTIIHKVTQVIVAIKEKNPSSTVNSIREALSVSDLFLSDIPAVINNCARNLTDDAASTRDSLRTVMTTITDGLVGGTVDDDGKPVATREFLKTAGGMGLDVIGTLDPTGIVKMMTTFIQPICGPTAFVGEIDDGSLADALALTTEGPVFNGSYGTWKKAGDGRVIITFESADTENVTVVIHSGGDTIAKIDVASGKTVHWQSTVKDLQDKTLLIDRWQPGLLGVPTSAGGSLVLWVPRSKTRGHISLHVKINGEESDDDTEDVKHKTNETKDTTTPMPAASEEDQTTQGQVTQQEIVSSSSGTEQATVTPAPTASEEEDQTTQGQVTQHEIVSSSSGTEEATVTPAPTTSEEEDQTTEGQTTQHEMVIKSKYPNRTMPQLIVTLLRASNLPVGDTMLQGSGSDPFVTIQLGDEYLCSSCVSGSLDPVWQPAETFEFEVPHTSRNAERHVVVRVVDNDRFKVDDLLGELRLPLSTFERRPNEASVETYELQVPESLKSACKVPDKKTTIQLDICFAEETDGQKTLCIWENEDWVDGKWTPSHNNERRHWSTFDLQTSSDNFDQVAPDVPDGLEGSGWAYSTKKGDDHGWIYASTYTGPWASTASPTCYARRRLWQNNCRPAVACE